MSSHIINRSPGVYACAVVLACVLDRHAIYTHARWCEHATERQYYSTPLSSPSHLSSSSFMCDKSNSKHSPYLASRVGTSGATAPATTTANTVLRCHNYHCYYNNIETVSMLVMASASVHQPALLYVARWRSASAGP